MGRKIGTEKNLDINGMKLKFGTTDRQTPSVVYFEGGTYITPQKEEKCYKNEINEIRKEMTKFGNKFSSDNGLSENNIFNFEVADDRIGVNRGTYLSFQYFFKQHISHDFDELSDKLIHSMKDNSSFFGDCFKRNGFSYSKTK